MVTIMAMEISMDMIRIMEVIITGIIIPSGITDGVSPLCSVSTSGIYGETTIMDGMATGIIISTMITGTILIIPAVIIQADILPRVIPHGEIRATALKHLLIIIMFQEGIIRLLTPTGMNLTAAGRL